eukprot:Skav232048  [mRNA]  locus=scaffold6250:63317:65197:+ [translate_table: standard]
MKYCRVCQVQLPQEKLKRIKSKCCYGGKNKLRKPSRGQMLSLRGFHDELLLLEQGAQRLGQMERMDVVTKGMGTLLKTSNKQSLHVATTAVLGPVLAQIYSVGGAILLFVILVTWSALIRCF